MQEKIKKARNQLPYIPDTFRLIWKASRSWTVAWFCLLILQGLLPIALVYLSGGIADEIGTVLQTRDWAQYSRLVLWVVLVSFLLLTSQSLGSLLNWVRSVQSDLVQDHIYGLIHKKAIELDLSFYDSPAYYDRLYRARVDAYDRPMALLENIGALLQNILTFGAMAVILLRFAWWIPLALIAGMLPVLAVVTRFSIREFLWRNQSTHARRRVDYFDWILTDRQSAAEVRLFNLGESFERTYQAIRARLRNERAGLVKSQAIAELIAGAVALLSAGLVMLWVIGRLVNGLATLGDAAVLYQAFSQGQRLIQTLLGSAGQVLKNTLFIENLFEFLKTTPIQSVPKQSKLLGRKIETGICFKKVSFHYPDSDHQVLKNFNLSIPAGKLVALVGENGAGKSTVIKLLCRFYDPSHGQITIDGDDLRDFDPKQLWRSITVLFQEPVHFHESAEKNIGFGDINSNPSNRKIIKAARAAGAHDLIRKLPAGYETALGKWFGGTELSSGEWQRIALARAFLRNSPIILLDEPTSAMDSWAELDWMAKFKELLAGQTVILITHRFTTAMQADYIHVMNAGHVIESGTHHQLLEKNGKYAQSWQGQMHLSEQQNGKAISK